MLVVILTISCITTGICSVISIKDSFLVQPAGEGEDFSRQSHRPVTPEQSKCASYWHYSGTVRHRMCAVSVTKETGLLSFVTYKNRWSMTMSRVWEPKLYTCCHGNHKCGHPWLIIYISPHHQHGTELACSADCSIHTWYDHHSPRILLHNTQDHTTIKQCCDTTHPHKLKQTVNSIHIIATLLLSVQMQ